MKRETKITDAHEEHEAATIGSKIGINSGTS